MRNRPVIRLTPQAAQQEPAGEEAPRERPIIHLTEPASALGSDARLTAGEPARERPVIRCR